MFNGNGVLEMDRDHLDVSYRNPETWPNLTPLGSIKSFSFEMGDPQVGPVVQLGLITPRDEEPLDWAHSIDPPHFHGSDQFRVIVGGQWQLASHTLEAGDIAFQESGLRYREHPGEGDSAWMVLVVGDRRGLQPTILRRADQEQLFDFGTDDYKPAGEDEDYPHPAGPGGVAAVATTIGPCERGYLKARLAAIPDGQAESGVAALTGVWGDPGAGPVAHGFHAAAKRRISPASHCDTERLLIVTAGSCRVGEKEYFAGDMRIQGAETAMPEMVSGAEGLDAVIVVADRRARTATTDEGIDLPQWLRQVPAVRV